MNYTYLRRGNTLPSVGVLQKILNSFGAGLDPDGEFGSKTEQAVQHFQNSRRLTPDGIVGRHTWPKLVAGLNLPIVDAIDVYDSLQKQILLARKDKRGASWPDTYADEADDIRSAGGRPFLLGGTCNGVEQAVSMISAGARMAFLVRFHGHGHPGSVAVSAGVTGMAERNKINPETLPMIRDALLHLRSVFGPYGSVEFMGCETARGVEGRDFVQHMAWIFGVPVTAGVNDQYGGDVSTFRFEGPTYTAFPPGQSLRQWCQTLPDFPKPPTNLHSQSSAVR